MNALGAILAGICQAVSVLAVFRGLAEITAGFAVRSVAATARALTH